jgi:D-lactate dehydrogenase (cytochrome)
MSIIASLQQALGNEHVITDDAERNFYAHDVFRAGELPSAVVRPGTVDELQAVVRLAHDSGTPIISRGGGASYTDAYRHNAPGGITIDTSRLTRIEINEQRATVTVEAGVTWAALREALSAKGYKTKFWGSYSGLYATVGGGTSMNAISHGKDTAADSVVAFEIITGTGEIIRTGSAINGKGVPFFRHYGPDLTGLFTGDCGALGVKARITLALETMPPAFATASFSFDTFEAMHAAFRATAMTGVVEENFGLSETLQQGQLGKADTGAKLEMAGAVMKNASSIGEGLGKLAKMAMSGERAIAAATYAGHFIVEGVDAADAKSKIALVKKLCAEHGKEIPNSVPEVVRAMPFAPFHNVLGPKGERWVPIHTKLPHDRVVAFHAALQDLFARERPVLDACGIITGGMFMSVGSTAFVYEPAFYWPDAQTVYHERIVDPDYRAALPTYPRNETAEAEVVRIKASVVDLMHDHGGVHFQIGRTYPYARDHDPLHWALLKTVKAQLDPKGILNPGVLGL